IEAAEKVQALECPHLRGLYPAQKVKKFVFYNSPYKLPTKPLFRDKCITAASQCTTKVEGKLVPIWEVLVYISGPPQVETKLGIWEIFKLQEYNPKPFRDPGPRIRLSGPGNPFSPQSTHTFAFTQIPTRTQFSTLLCHFLLSGTTHPSNWHDSEGRHKRYGPFSPEHHKPDHGESTSTSQENPNSAPSSCLISGFFSGVLKNYEAKSNI
ncbi:hypothetical protein SK128_016456, partial [Halocaridina rubra]